MKRFYNISTSDYKPISHGNIYLCNEYNKIKNFLVSQDQKELLKVLAIPFYKNNHIEWRAKANNEIKKLNQFNQTHQKQVLFKYNEFLNSFNSFIKKLKSSKNQDNKNWGELLLNLIEGSANELFFDGKNIFITWGWQLLDQNSKKLIPIYRPKTIIETNITEHTEEKKNKTTTTPINNKFEKTSIENNTKKLSWLNKCYLFFSYQWWIIPLISLCILITLILTQ